jgi:fumarylacetoacetate (FAA) hydrolase
MKLVSFLKGQEERLGLYLYGRVYDLNACDPLIPCSMNEFLQDWDIYEEKARLVEHQLGRGGLKIAPEIAYTLIAPVPHPASCRDGYAFRQHVEAARRNRGLPMIPQFDQYPVFYFTNHQAIYGPGGISCMPDHFQKLDFELEMAIVIGRKGRNIKAEDADSYIAGYMIMNDLSARTLQIEEMLMNLGPAKGKDFATVTGPWLVTPDELESYKTAPKPGHTGNSYNLKMTCAVNGIEVSKGNMADMDWTFAEIIERASYGCDLFPGDIIGSGTVGTGCFLELNGTGLLNDARHKPQWLEAGDVVEMEITGLGTLRNTIVAEDTCWSILNAKKIQLTGRHSP